MTTQRVLRLPRRVETTEHGVAVLGTDEAMHEVTESQLAEWVFTPEQGLRDDHTLQVLPRAWQGRTPDRPALWFARHPLLRDDYLYNARTARGDQVSRMVMFTGTGLMAAIFATLCIIGLWTRGTVGEVFAVLLAMVVAGLATHGGLTYARETRRAASKAVRQTRSDNWAWLARSLGTDEFTPDWRQVDPLVVDLADALATTSDSTLEIITQLNQSQDALEIASHILRNPQAGDAETETAHAARRHVVAATAAAHRRAADEKTARETGLKVLTDGRDHDLAVQASVDAIQLKALIGEQLEEV